MKNKRSLGKGKAGRKKGSKTKPTLDGGDQHENQMRARWGTNHSTAGGALTHQAWIDRNPQGMSLRMNALNRKVSENVLRAEAREAPLPTWYCEKIAGAIDGRDWRFFADAADTLKRIGNDGVILEESPVRARLLSYVEVQNWGKQARSFTLHELLESVDWGSDSSGSLRPSERQLVRLCKELGIPRPKGRPAKNK